MKYKYITAIGVVIIVLSISIISLILPDKEISDLEGRKLQEIPLPNKVINEYFNTNAYLYELLTGEMFKKWDSYFSDHIFKRDSIVNVYTAIQEVLDKKYVNGAFLGKDGYIFSSSNVMRVSSEELKNRAEHFNLFAKQFKNSEMYIVNLPDKSMIYEDKLPIEEYKNKNNTYIEKMLKYIDKSEINVLDFRSVISSDEDLYYKTDHHWNMNGVYKAYEYIINSIKYKFDIVESPKVKEDFDIKIYEKYFVGTDGRKISSMIKEGEDIEIYHSDDLIKFRVKGTQGNKLIYDNYLDKDKLNNDYIAYLGGDNPEIIINNINANNNLKVVMIGDSMDNPLIPLMAYHFKELYSYDLRHYSKDIINKIHNINPDIIIFSGLSENFLDNSNNSVFKWNI